MNNVSERLCGFFTKSNTECQKRVMEQADGIIGLDENILCPVACGADCPYGEPVGPMRILGLNNRDKYLPELGGTRTDDVKVVTIAIEPK
jgi:hypothetical protein